MIYLDFNFKELEGTAERFKAEKAHGPGMIRSEIIKLPSSKCARIRSENIQQIFNGRYITSSVEAGKTDLNTKKQQNAIFLFWMLNENFMNY